MLSIVRWRIDYGVFTSRASVSHFLTQRGRWWLVGAPWKQSGSEGPPGDSIRPSKSNREEMREPLLQDKIMGLAAKQRMNTDVRRSIFSVIVTSADYEDAFERLMSLNLRCVKVLRLLLISSQDWHNITLDPLFCVATSEKGR